MGAAVLSEDAIRRMGTFIGPDALEGPRARAALRWWDQVRGAAALPPRSAIEPRAMKPFLPGVVLIEREPQDFRYRVVGEDVVAAHGRSFRGLAIGECGYPADVAAVLRRFLGGVVETAQPVAVRGHLAHVARGHMTHEGVYLPFGPAEGVPTHILAVTDFGRPAQP